MRTKLSLFYTLTAKVILLLLVIFIINSCKKQLWVPKAPSEALIAKAKSFYTKQILSLELKDRQVMDANAQGSKASKRKNPAPIWENATLETTLKGETLLTVPISKYQIDNKDLDYTRKFVFSESGGEIVDGKIVEVYGSPELIAEHGEEMITKTGEKQIGGFTGLIIGYDLNYDYKDGKYYKDGVMKKGSAYVGTKRPDTTKKAAKQSSPPPTLTASKDLHATSVNKPAQRISSFVPIFEDGYNCDYFYRVYIERDEYGQITYWENLGFAYRICTPTQDPNEPGGIREFYVDCAGVLNGGAYYNEACKTCMGGTTGIITVCAKDPCDEKANVKLRASDMMNLINKNVIIANSTTNEWGAEQNVPSLSGFPLFNSTTPRTNSATNSFTPIFTWNSINGFTIGAAHGHPGSNGPSPKDIFWMLQHLNNPDLIASGGTNYYKQHVSVTTYTPDGTAYVVSINDWGAVAAEYQTYLNNINLYNSTYSSDGSAYLAANYGAAQAMAGVWALLGRFGSAINIYKSAPGTTDFVPLLKSNFQVLEKPCPN